VIKESKRFFFEKKKQKTFGPWGRWHAPARARSKQKFFASPGGAPFFQKRSAFLYFSRDVAGLLRRLRLLATTIDIT
jgi:hypothetical protein